MKITVAGAESLLGSELLRVLFDAKLGIEELRPVRGSDAPQDEEKDSTVDWGDDELELIEPGPSAYEGTDVAFFAGSQDDAGAAAKLSIARAPLSIDLSGRFSDNRDVPLVLPGVNDAALEKLPAHALIAVPDAASAMIAATLAPIHRAFEISRVTISTYEAASGRGREGMDALGKQIRALFNYQSIDAEIFPRMIAFNAIPQIDERESDGYTRGERVMARALARLLGVTNLDTVVTRAWVPIFSGHSASVTADCAKPITRDTVIAALEDSGADVRDASDDEIAVNGDAVGGDDLVITRLRLDRIADGDPEARPSGTRLSLWVTADNLRRGSAIGARDIARAVLGKKK